MKSSGKKMVTINRKAYHDYEVEFKLEAGIELFGTEVKSIRNGRINLKDSYCLVEKGELFVYNMHITPYEYGNIFNRDPLRKRKLLLHKKEILNLYSKVKRKGYSIIVLSVYFLNSRVKLEIGLCRGKKLYDKRASLKEKEVKRNLDRVSKKSFSIKILGA